MKNIWSHLDEKTCPCQGTGWHKISEWENCFVHFKGQLHPETRSLLLDDPVKLKEETRRASLQWELAWRKKERAVLSEKLEYLSTDILILEKELINKTPTIKMSITKIDK